MGEADAQKLVVGSILVTGGVVFWHGLRTRGKASPDLRTLTALSVLAAVLLVLASVVPALAAGLAVLIGLGVVTSRIGK